MDLPVTKKLTINKEIYTMLINITTNSYFNKNGIVIRGVFYKNIKP